MKHYFVRFYIEKNSPSIVNGISIGTDMYHPQMW